MGQPVDVTPTQAPSLLRFITCGSVDDGKSTLIGRLLYDSKSIFEDQMDALDRDSKRFGTQGDALDLALLVDGLAAEREQGITIDVAYRYFATPHRAFIVADTPGHEQYTRNMATGASTAELAIILIDARKGILAQTRRHSFIVSMLGVRHVAVAINKMDLVSFDARVFQQICDAYRALATELGFASIALFPISARDGDNVASLSDKTPWYTGPALLPYLEKVAADQAQSEGGAVLPVQWVNRPNLDFRGFSGTLVRGRVSVGERITALPRGTHSTVTRIVTANGDLPSAGEGQAITLTLADEIDVSRGDVLVSAQDVPVVSPSFQARLLWTGDRGLTSGRAYVLKLGTATAEARVLLKDAIDIHSYARKPATALDMNGIGTADIMLDRALALVPYKDNRDLGGFILIDRFTNETVAFGLVEQVVAAPKVPSHDTPPAPHTWAMWAMRASSFFVGPQETAAHRLSAWALLGLTTLASAAVVWALSGSAAIAVGFGLIDLVLRPVLRWVWAQKRQASHPRAPAPFFNDGSDI